MNAPAKNITDAEYFEGAGSEIPTDFDPATGVTRTTHFVYRFWSDTFPEGKQLLYVGFTSEFGARDAIHWCNSWWRGLVTRIDMDVYPCSTRTEARAAEARTIKAEVPLFNIHKNPRHDEVHGAQWTSANVEPLFFAELQKLVRADAVQRGVSWAVS